MVAGETTLRFARDTATDDVAVGMATVRWKEPAS